MKKILALTLCLILSTLALCDRDGGGTAICIHPRPAQLRDRPEQVIFHLLAPKLAGGCTEMGTAFRRMLQYELPRNRTVPLHL